MKLNLLSKNLNAFGLEVSSSSFKIMQLKKKGKEVLVKAYADVGVPKAVIISGVLVIAIADAFSDALGIHISEESENKHRDYTFSENLNNIDEVKLYICTV